MTIRDCDDRLPDLVAKAKEGNAEALDRLCVCCYEQVLRYFLLRIPAEAEDLTQQLFADLPRKLTAYRESGRFRAWLQAVAHNLFLTANRTEGRRPEVRMWTGFDAARSETPTRHGTAKADLKQLVRQLPPTLREPWEMHVQRYKDGEIAAELGISKGAVATRLTRARERLLELLRERLSEDL